MSAPAPSTPINGGAPPVIEIRDLKKSYDMGSEKVRALDGVSLEVKKGEYVAIMGPSGSGKSTLMNLIGCLDTPSEGSYRLAGREVAKLDDNQLAQIRNREIGFVFQTFNLLARTTALQKVGLADRGHHRPNELSGGQRQRVAIARALVNNPSLVLADEPTGNLDSKTGDEIMKLFDELNQQGHTLVVVTHEEDIAAHTERIVRLLDGKIQSDAVNAQRRRA